MGIQRLQHAHNKVALTACNHVRVKRPSIDTEGDRNHQACIKAPGLYAKLQSSNKQR
jgi:hypothetical protein